VSAKHTVKRPRRSSKATVPTRGQANLQLLRKATDAAIRRSSPSELADLPPDFWDDALLVVPEAKVPISLRVDSDVLEWFREVGPKYQSRMNAVLRSYMQRSRKKPKRKSRSGKGRE
jgi:uncharacterized protein (DUF4415 family)